LRSYEQRSAERRAAQQGRQEAVIVQQKEEAAAKQSRIDHTPPHLRRRENTFRKLIEELQSKAYRPDVQRRLADLELRAAARDREIDREMEEKKRQYEIESNPETVKAREHWLIAAENCEDGERTEFARLRGLIEGGGASQYWKEVSTLIENRRTRISAAIEADKAEHAIADEKQRGLQAQLETIDKLTVEPA
jgi:hypothetical protein